MPPADQEHAILAELAGALEHFDRSPPLGERERRSEAGDAGADDRYGAHQRQPRALHRLGGPHPYPPPLCGRWGPKRCARVPSRLSMASPGVKTRRDAQASLSREAGEGGGGGLRKPNIARYSAAGT